MAAQALPWPPLTDPDGGGGSPFDILSPVNRHFWSIFSRVLSVPTLVGKSIPWPPLNYSYMELKQWAKTEIRCFPILEFKETTKVKTDKGNIDTWWRVYNPLKVSRFSWLYWGFYSSGQKPLFWTKSTSQFSSKGIFILKIDSAKATLTSASPLSASLSTPLADLTSNTSLKGLLESFHWPSLRVVLKRSFVSTFQPLETLPLPSPFWTSVEVRLL